MRYDDSGVSIERAKHAKEKILRLAKSTWRREVLSEAGAFGGLFELGKSYKKPVLVSSIDGVGTKVIVSMLARRFDTIGQDLVNHCVNDILVQGAKPLFFLDYIAASALDPDVVASVVEGIVDACRQNRCALIGGETAEMPGVYVSDKLDLAGCIVGVVEKEGIIDGSRIRPGDVVFALPSTGLHTNGFSLARKVLFDKMRLGPDDFVDTLGCTVADELLKVHASYLEPITETMKHVTIKGMAHITGGGIQDNVARILPKLCDAVIEKGSWPIPRVFDCLEKNGNIPEDEMFRVFNMGVGMILVADEGAEESVRALGGGDPYFHAIGKIKKGKGRVFLT